MKFAIIGDIHGNIYSLEAVLEDIKNKNVDFIVCTGDLVGYMPYPNEVIDMLRENRVLVIQGNHDEYMGSSKRVTDEDINKLTDEEIQKVASGKFTRWVITENNKEYLRDLPKALKLEVNGLKLIAVHGSPRNISEYMYEDEAILREVSKGLEEDIIISGHTHIPYIKKLENKTFINVGSVGKPKDKDSRSSYIILNIKEKNIESTIERVVYDIDKMVNDIQSNRMISNSLINMLKEGF